MKMLCKRLGTFIYVICGLATFFIILPIYANNNSPVGYWRTIDDHTHQPAGIVQIWQHENTLYGKILQIFTQGGNKPTDICKYCPGELHNKPILGMTFLWGLKLQDDGSWGGGSIMDPKIGKIYRCKIKLIDNGQKLLVRGYIGFSLLGRSQTWERVDKSG